MHQSFFLKSWLSPISWSLSAKHQTVGTLENVFVGLTKEKKGKEEERNQSMFPKSQKENMPQILGHGFSSDLYLISTRIQFFIPLPYLGPKTILCHYLRKPKLY